MLQKKGESEEMGERTGIREKWKWRKGGREKELQLKLPTATLVGMNLADPSPLIFSVSLNFYRITFSSETVLDCRTG